MKFHPDNNRDNIFLLLDSRERPPRRMPAKASDLTGCIINFMKKNNSNGGNIGFEEKLWKTADKLRNNMDAAEYKHIVLGLIFLKYISDAFEERYKQLEKEVANPKSDLFVKEPDARYEAIEDKDEYKALNIFYVPEKARWQYLQKKAKQPTIGKIIDDAM